MNRGGAGRLVEFRSQGAALRGRFYEHPGEPRPTVIMAHGFSATITGMVADRYAEVLYAAGINVLLYDHKGFGLSGGEPKSVLNRWTQAIGYRDAIDFASALPSVDPERVALWGDSMSGGVAVCVAAFDERVAALVVQVPACGDAIAPDDSDATAYAALRDIYRSGGPHGYPIECLGPMPVVSPDHSAAPSLLEPITAYRWFMTYGTKPETGWRNEAILETVATPAPFHPGLCAAHLHGPSLWVVAAEDEMPGAATSVARSVFEATPEPKELCVIDGGHFGLLYHPSDLFDRVSLTQAAFLVRHLEPGVPSRGRPRLDGDRAAAPPAGSTRSRACLQRGRG